MCLWQHFSGHSIGSVRHPAPGKMLTSTVGGKLGLGATRILVSSSNVEPMLLLIQISRSGLAENIRLGANLTLGVVIGNTFVIYGLRRPVPVRWHVPIMATSHIHPPRYCCRLVSGHRILMRSITSLKMIVPIRSVELSCASIGGVLGTLLLLPPSSRALA